MIYEKIQKDTRCPHCKNNLDDDDGVFFDKMANTKECLSCGISIEYVKQLKKDYGNPYCDYVWDKTYIRCELNG